MRFDSSERPWGVPIPMNKLLAALAITLMSSAWSPLLTPAAAQSSAAVRGLPDFADLVDKAGPAVVNIRTTERAKSADRAAPQIPMPEGMDENDPFYEFFRRFFPPRQGPGPGGPGGPGGPRGGGNGGEVPRGVGSGFIISSDGYVMTNHHVVDGADDIYVTLTDKREMKAKLIGSDRRTDVAIVKIEGSNLPRLPIGDPMKTRVGEWVVAIGSPFGLENTVTAGIVSAKGRDTGDYLPFIQTDVAVNPGNSGGPLLNLDGEVIGINSQIYSRTGGFMGISFAIPIDEAMRISEQLRTTGKVVRGRIGVGIAEVTKDVAEPLGLPRPSGALVRNVEGSGPADKAGIEVGDIILKFDNKAVEKSSDLPRIVGNTRPGTKVSLQVWRKGQTRDLNVTVGETEPEKSARAGGDKPSTPGQGGNGALASNAYGVAVTDLDGERKSQLKLKSGVYVESVDPSGAAARSGVRQGDVILAVNNQDVGNTRQFNEALGKLDKAKTAVFLVRRGDSASYVPIRPLASAQ